MPPGEQDTENLPAAAIVPFCDTTPATLAKACALRARPQFMVHGAACPLEPEPGVCFHQGMTTLLMEIRRATQTDAPDIAAVHDAAWRATYRGIIPGVDLERMVERRGPAWWQAAINRGSRLSVLRVGGTLAGYVNFGGNRAKGLPYGGEIYEIYLHPHYQGLGMGERLFSAARRDLAVAGLKGLVAWALAENTPAAGFYRTLGGQAVASSTEKFGTKTLDKIAFAWQR